MANNIKIDSNFGKIYVENYSLMNFDELDLIQKIDQKISCLKFDKNFNLKIYLYHNNFSIFIENKIDKNLIQNGSSKIVFQYKRSSNKIEKYMKIYLRTKKSMQLRRSSFGGDYTKSIKLNKINNFEELMNKIKNHSKITFEEMKDYLENDIQKFDENIKFIYSNSDKIISIINEIIINEYSE